MTKAFNDAEADFSGMTGKPRSEVPMTISQIVHRAVIEVAEEATEAARRKGAEQDRDSSSAMPARAERQSQYTQVSPFRIASPTATTRWSPNRR